MTQTIFFRAGATCLILLLTACGTTTPSVGTSPAPASTASSTIEAALPLIRTGAAVATGAVLDFAVKQTGTRTRLANEMYAAANAVYSLSGGTFPPPTQFESTILAFGGSQADANYAQFSTAIAGLYAAYYPKLASGDAKTGADLLNAIAGGIEDATQAYITVPANSTSETDFDGINGIRGTELTEFLRKDGGSQAARTRAIPGAPWERENSNLVSF